MTRLAIVMPAYNEEACIEKVATAWIELLKDNFSKSGSLIVVNDGSRDSTGKILDALLEKHDELVVIHKENSGHGSSLFVGYERALQDGYDWVFQVDSDDQFVPGDFLKLWERRDESQVILGIRENRDDPFDRLMISRMLRFLIVGLFGVYVPDPNIPFRLFKSEVLAQMLKHIDRSVFAPNIFLSIISRSLGYDTLNIPVSHLRRRTGQVSIVGKRILKACVQSFFQLIRLRLGIAGIKDQIRIGLGNG